MAWERVLKQLERRERWTILAGFVAGPLVIVTLGSAMVLLLRFAVGWSTGYDVVGLSQLPMVLGVATVFGGLVALIGHWRKLTLGETTAELLDDLNHIDDESFVPVNPLIALLLLAVCTCGTWLLFDALLRMWEAWRLRRACRWRVAAALSLMHRTASGVSAADLARPGETAERPGALSDVLRYLALRRLATADASGIHALSLAMRQESWLDPLLGPPVTSRRA